MRPGAARQLVTFLARPRKVTQRRPPRCRAPLLRGYLRCLTRCGDYATRPGEAHTTCLTAGLVQCSSKAPHRVELLGATQGGRRFTDYLLHAVTIVTTVMGASPVSRDAGHAVTTVTPSRFYNFLD